MGMRAYFLIEAIDGLEQREYLRIVREIEETPGIDFVDPVIGPPDMVVMVDAPITVEALASKIRSRPWVKNMRILRVVSIFERHKSGKISRMPLFEIALDSLSAQEKAETEAETSSPQSAARIP